MAKELCVQPCEQSFGDFPKILSFKPLALGGYPELKLAGGLARYRQIYL